MYHLLSCLKKKLPLYRHSVILSPIAGFLSLVRVIQFSQFEKGILCNGSVFWVFYDYSALYLIFSVRLPRLFCFYIYFLAILKIQTWVFLMPVRVTHFTHSL